MTGAESLVETLRARGVTLWSEEGRLRYRAPRGGLDPGIVEQIRAHRAEIIEIVSRGGGRPLSFAQERLWFLSRLGLAGSAYHIPMPFHLQGPLDEQALRRSFESLIARHASLRTRFADVAGEGLQYIEERVSLPFERVDLTGVEAAERDVRLRQTLLEGIERPFVLSEAPLMRVMLVKLAAGEHVLLITVHHIVSDGWSLLSVFPRELAKLYEAHRQGREVRLPALPMQYADFAVWQRQWLSGERLERQLGYWRERLRDVAPLDLPTDRNRPAVESHRGATVPLDFGAELSRAVHEFARREGITPFMAVLAALQWVLSRWSGQEDIAVGAAIAGRTHPDSEGIIGFFVNTLVLRTQVSPGLTVRELLARVKEVTLGAYAHQDVPFERLVAELQPQRDLSRQPLFQVLLALHNVPYEAFSLSGVTARWLPQPAVTAKFDLTLHVFELPDGMSGYCDFATDLFDAVTVERLLDHWKRVLAGMVREPQAALATLALMSESERDQVQRLWNQTTVDYPRDQCLHDWFAAQAKRTPDAIAVSCAGEDLTYRELDERSTRLARHLREQGVKAEAVVGLCVPRSPDLLIGLLGILKAGGAYLPLDPGYPRQRLQYMIRDSGAQRVLTHTSVRAALGDHGVPETYIDAEAHIIARHSCEPIGRTAQPGNLAYLIYTSGSTGEPKGVMGIHGAAVNYFHAIRDAYGLSSSDVVLQLTSISFDASIRDLVGPLLLGARLCLLSTEEALSSEKIHGAIDEYRVNTILSITPTLLRHLLEGAHTHTGIRRICVSGEPLHGADLAAARRTFGENTVIVNHYGPAEATMTCSYHAVPLSSSDEYRESRIPIGRPIANVQLYVLDGHLQPVPIGVVGELCVGGAGVTRGYIGREDLTAQQFVADPMRAGGRLYRTGDLARYRRDGTLEFLGRRDHQVKLRGNRIELGEIEAALLRIEGISEAVAAVREDALGEPRLVAWLAGPAHQLPDRREIRKELAESLPQYMIPSAFVFLPELPLLPNGKVDRGALPAPTAFHTTQYVAPRTPTEQALADIWAELLPGEQVAVTSNFFELGGHSMLALRMLARARSTLGVDIPLKLLFESPTVEGLALLVERERAHARDRVPDQPIVRRGARPPLPMSVGQKIFESIYDGLEHCEILHSWVSQRLVGPLDVQALEESFLEIVSRHASLRMQYPRDASGTPQLQVSDEPRLDFVFIPHTDDVESAVVDAVARRFNLATGPLLRVLVVRLAPAEHLMTIIVHHSVFDAWSFGVLIRELSALYTGRVTGKPVQLPPLPIDLQDYTAWLYEWLAGEGGRRSLEFWRRTFAGGEKPFELPVDEVPATAVGSRNFLISGGVSDSTVRALRELALQEGAMLSTVVLTAFAIAMSRWSGRDDVFIDVNHPCRLRPEVQDLIGFIAEVWVMRTNVGGGRSFLDVLRQIVTLSREATEHMQVPLGILFPELKKLPRTQPLLLTTFNYINRDFLGGRDGSTERLLAPDLRMEHVPKPMEATRFLAESTNKKLSVAIIETRESLSWSIEYAGHRFSEASVEAFSGNLARLLESVASDPHFARAPLRRD